MRSPKQLYKEKVRKLLSEENRFTDMTAQVRVYRRNPDGKPEPAELLPETYGGVYDSWLGEYVELGDTPHEIVIHGGGIEPLSYFDRPEKSRVLILGAPGTGKTEELAAIALLLALWFQGKPGGFVCPTRPRMNLAWNKLIKIIPPHWIATKKDGNTKYVELKNGSKISFFASKRTAKEAGYSMAGEDWFWAVEEEQQDIEDGALKEIDARLRINPQAQIFSGATNEPWGYFQRRVKEYEVNPAFQILRMHGQDNCFVPLDHWDRLRDKWSAEEYRRKVLLEDLPHSGRVYGMFSMKEHVTCRPQKGQIGPDPDITYQITKQNLDDGYQLVVGTDFGRTSVSVVLKCYKAYGLGGLLNRADGYDRQWWVVGEIITSGKTAEYHAQDVLAWMAERGFTKDDFICITGQDSNSVDPDKSDFHQFKNKGINIMKANYGKAMTRRWRYSMVNACLMTGRETKHLFIDCDKKGVLYAPKTAESLGNLMYGPDGKADSNGKGARGEDLTHWTDALGYALWRFEHYRGEPSDAAAPRTAQAN